MRISELAEKAEMKASAIRYYEARGLLRRPARASGHRVYGPSDVGRLRLIRAATEAGFTLEEVKRLVVNGEPVRPLAAEKLAALEAQCTRLRVAMTCECAGDPERCALV